MAKFIFIGVKATAEEFQLETAEFTLTARSGPLAEVAVLHPPRIWKRIQHLRWQLYLSGGGGGCPFLTVLAQRVRDGAELSCDSGDDDFVRFFRLAGAICERPQAWVVMRRDQRRLEHLVPQGTATSGGALGELQVSARQMGFDEAVAGLTQALDRLPSAGTSAAGPCEKPRKNNH